MTDQYRLRKNGPKYGTRKSLAEHCGVTVMTTWRWGKNPELNFPKPAIINNIPYFDFDEVDAWMRSRVVDRIKAATEPQPLPPTAPDSHRARKSALCRGRQASD